MEEEVVKNEEISEEIESESKGLSVASMVLGIVSLVLFCFTQISLPCAIGAIICSVLGRKKGGKGMATAGLVLGIISIVLLVIIFALAFAVGFSIGIMEELANY